MCMIVAAWLFGPLYNAARIIPTSGITASGVCIHHFIWPNRFWNSFTSVITCTLYLFLPLTVILCLYVSIFLKLRNRASQGSLSEGNQKQADIMNEAKINVLKTSIILITCLFFCWIWNISWYLLFSVGVPFSTMTPFYNFSVFMMNLNCCINPFCYAVQYREFQQQVRNIFCKCKRQTLNDNMSINTSSTSVMSI